MCVVGINSLPVCSELLVALLGGHAFLFVHGFTFGGGASITFFLAVSALWLDAFCSFSLSFVLSVLNPSALLSMSPCFWCLESTWGGSCCPSSWLARSGFLGRSASDLFWFPSPKQLTVTSKSLATSVVMVQKRKRPRVVIFSLSRNICFPAQMKRKTRWKLLQLERKLTASSLKHGGELHRTFSCFLNVKMLDPLKKPCCAITLTDYSKPNEGNKNFANVFNPLHDLADRQLT